MAGEVLVLNPRRRRRRTRSSAKKRPVRRRRRRVMRHNPARFTRRRRSAPRRRRRSVRRNPRILGGNLQGQLMQGVSFAGGIIATEFIANKIAGALPEAWKTNADLVRIGTKAAVGIAVPMLFGKMLPRNIRNAIAIGGAAAVVLDVFKTYVAPKIGLSMSGYEYGSLTDYEQGELTGFGMSDEGAAYGGGAY